MFIIPDSLNFPDSYSLWQNTRGVTWPHSFVGFFFFPFCIQLNYTNILDFVYAVENTSNGYAVHSNIEEGSL